MKQTSEPRHDATHDLTHDPGLQERLVEIHERLCRTYHCPIPYFHDADPLSSLISSLLSHRTRNADTGRALRNLRARFADWRAVMEADPAEVEAAVRPCTWPEQKGPRIQAVLRRIQILRGELSLDFLAGMPVDEARAWLEALPGVGPKTSGSVMAFSSLRRRALVVDCHHHRVAQRLGLIPPRMAVGPSHAFLEALLPDDWSPQQVYDHHEVMMLHGQKVCYFSSPACYRCPLLALCPEGQRRQSTGRRHGPGDFESHDDAGQSLPPP